jgi:hypothetical protein
MLPCTPLNQYLLKTPLSVAATTLEIVLAPVETRVVAGDVVTVVHLSLELPTPRHHGPLLLGSGNSSTQPGNHGVGLHHHGLCLRVCMPRISGHALQVLRSNQAS